MFRKLTRSDSATKSTSAWTEEYIRKVLEFDELSFIVDSAFFSYDVAKANVTDDYYADPDSQVSNKDNHLYDPRRLYNFRPSSSVIFNGAECRSSIKFHGLLISSNKPQKYDREKDDSSFGSLTLDRSSRSGEPLIDFRLLGEHNDVVFSIGHIMSNMRLQNIRPVVKLKIAIDRELIREGYANVLKKEIPVVGFRCACDLEFSRSSETMPLAW